MAWLLIVVHLNVVTGEQVASYIGSYSSALFCTGAAAVYMTANPESDISSIECKKVTPSQDKT